MKLVGIAPGVIPNLRNLPMVVCQGLDDERVKPDVKAGGARSPAAREKWGASPLLTTGSWPITATVRRLEASEKQFERLATPAGAAARGPRLAAQPRLETPVLLVALGGALAWLIVHARCDREKGEVRVEITPPETEVSRGRGLSVLLHEEMLDLRKPVTVICNRGKSCLRARCSGGSRF
ncbi:MAG: hypothetical protein R3E96_07945 [Planctomycetota bacterium]